MTRPSLGPEVRIVVVSQLRFIYPRIGSCHDIAYRVCVRRTHWRLGYAMYMQVIFTEQREKMKRELLGSISIK
jgi:hypothetical protein